MFRLLVLCILQIGAAKRLWRDEVRDEKAARLSVPCSPWKTTTLLRANMTPAGDSPGYRADVERPAAALPKLYRDEVNVANWRVPIRRSICAGKKMRLARRNLARGVQGPWPFDL